MNPVGVTKKHLKIQMLFSLNDKPLTLMIRFYTIIITFVMTLCIALPVEARKDKEINALIELMESYEEAKGVQYFNLNGMILKMAKPSIKKTPVGKAADDIDNLCIFSMNDAVKEVRAKFLKEADLLFKDYEMALEKTEEEVTSRIYVKKTSAGIIDELIVYNLGADIALIYIIGQIPVSSLEGISPSTEKEDKDRKDS